MGNVFQGGVLCKNMEKGTHKPIAVMVRINFEILLL